MLVDSFGAVCDILVLGTAYVVISPVEWLELDNRKPKNDEVTVYINLFEFEFVPPTLKWFSSITKVELVLKVSVDGSFNIPAGFVNCLVKEEEWCNGPIGSITLNLTLNLETDWDANTEAEWWLAQLAPLSPDPVPLLVKWASPYKTDLIIILRLYYPHS